jgi:hypothetical protein
VKSENLTLSINGDKFSIYSKIALEKLGIVNFYIYLSNVMRGDEVIN